MKYEYFNEKNLEKNELQDIEDESKIQEKDIGKYYHLNKVFFVFYWDKIFLKLFLDKKPNINEEFLGPFNIVPIMAYIYVFDCTLDYSRGENRLKLEKLRSEALKIFNTYHKPNDNIQIKPMIFFIANKFPFYIKPEKDKFNIDAYPKENFLIKNINLAKKILNENTSAQLIDE